MTHYNSDEDDSDEEPAFRYTPDDSSSVNPNTWTPSNTDTSNMWNVESEPNSMFCQDEQDEASEGRVYVLSHEDYPADWNEMKVHALERDQASCEQCGSHASSSDDMYVVATENPRQASVVSVELFETRCTDCTPTDARTTASVVLPQEIPRELTEGNVDVENPSRSKGSPGVSEVDETNNSYSLDTSTIDATTFFATPTFYLKFKTPVLAVSMLIVGAALVAGFAGALLSSPSAGVASVVSIAELVMQAGSVLLNPVVFAVTVSALYGLHLLDRDYRRAWRFHRKVPDTSRAKWIRLAVVSSVLAGVGFTGVATQVTSMTQAAMVSGVNVATLAVGVVYVVTGAYAARELDHTILTDLDTFEMDVRASMFAWTFRVGVFLTGLAATGWLAVSVRTFTALAAVAPLVGFAYLTMRFVSYRYSTPRESDSDGDSECVQFVASESEHHAPITSDIATDSLTGQARAWIDVTRQKTMRFVHRVRHNDRLDTYTTTHDKY